MQQCLFCSRRLLLVEIVALRFAASLGIPTIITYLWFCTFFDHIYCIYWTFRNVFLFLFFQQTILVNYFTLFVFSFSSEIAFCSLLNAILYQKYPISFAIAKLSRIGQISRVQLSPFFIKTLHRSTKTRLKLDTNSKFIAID